MPFGAYIFLSHSFISITIIQHKCIASKNKSNHKRKIVLLMVLLLLLLNKFIKCRYKVLYLLSHCLRQPLLISWDSFFAVAWERNSYQWSAQIILFNTWHNRCNNHEEGGGKLLLNLFLLKDSDRIMPPQLSS